MDPGLEVILARLRNDTLSSSSEMVRTAQEGIMAVCSATEAEWLQFAEQLYRTRPSVAPLYNMAALLRQNASGGTLRVHEAFASLALKEKDAAVSIASQAADLRGSTFITLSYSSTVMSCLHELAKGRKLRVIVLESLPMGEGAMTCAKLSHSNISVEMVDDSMAFAAMTEADQCIVGADAVTAEGVVNKVGTANLALAARYLHKECHVVTSTLKVAPIKTHDLMLSEERMAYRRRHQVFEITPLEMFSDFITDEGTLVPARMLEMLR